MTAKPLFTVAAIFNLLVGVPMLLAFPLVSRLLVTLDLVFAILFVRYLRSNPPAAT